MSCGSAEAMQSDDMPRGVAMRCLSIEPGHACGDAAAALRIPGGLLLALVDGLGHGERAAQAADLALKLLREAPEASLTALLARLDEGLRQTRGVAIGLARLGPGNLLSAAGVGNVALLLGHAGRFAALPSQPGFVGGGLPARIIEQNRALDPGDLVLLHTDGVSAPLGLGAVLPEWRRDPGLLCDFVLDRHRRTGDDAGVLACHWQPQDTTGPA